MIKDPRQLEVMEKFERDINDGELLPEIKEMLPRVLTVGELIEILQEVDPSLPVELEIADDTTSGGGLITSAFYAMAADEQAYENRKVLSISASHPHVWEAYKAEILSAL